MTVGAFLGEILHRCDLLGRRLAPPYYIGADWLELAIIASVFALVLLTFAKLSGLGRRLRQTRRNMLAAAY